MTSGYLFSLFLVSFFTSPAATSIPVHENGFPPSITQGPPERLQYLDRVDNISLVCEAEGSPKPSYTWLRNGMLVTCSKYHPNYICDNDGKLIAIINASYTGDVGKFQCFVSNHFGSTMSTVFEVKAYSIRATYDIDYVTKAEMNSGQKITCYSGTTTPGTSDKGQNADLIYPIHRWNTRKEYRDTPIDVITSERIQIHIKTGDIYYSNFETAGSLLYKCLRRVGKTLEEDSAYNNVTVQEAELQNFSPYLISAAMIPDYPPNTGLEGESVVFQCLFAGRPTPILSAASWFKHDGSLPLGRVTFSEYFTQLKISNLQPSDAGTYRCETAPFPGGARADFKLETKAAPRFDFEHNTPYSRNVTDGDTVTLNCKSYANPKASVQWYKNGVELNPDSLPPKYSMNADRTELTISPVCRDCGAWCGSTTDLMSVQCKATNQHGYSFVQGYLNVIAGGPAAPTTPSPSPTPGTVMCYNCEGPADSDCGVNVNSGNVESVYCFAGSCAISAYSSTGDNAISRVTRGCGKSEYATTSCVAHGIEMTCIKICTGSKCNGDLPSKTNG